MPQDKAQVALREGSLIVPLSRGRRSDAAVMKMQELGYDPMEVLVFYAQRENTPVDVKVDIAKTLLNYMYPKLSQVDVEVEDKDAARNRSHGSALAISEILKDPELTRQAQKLSIKFQEISRTVTVSESGEEFNAEEVMEGPDILDVDPEEVEGC